MSALAELRRKPRRIIGVDASTHSIAFGVIEDDKLVDYGQESFNGATVYERISSAKRVTRQLVESGRLQADAVCFESAIIAKSSAVGLKMAMVFGVCMGEILVPGPRLCEAQPLMWQSWLGNKALTAAEKRKLVEDNPGRSKSWYSNAGRELRKDRTRQWVYKTYGVMIESNDITDSIGIAAFANAKLL